MQDMKKWGCKHWNKELKALIQVQENVQSYAKGCKDVIWEAVVLKKVANKKYANKEFVQQSSLLEEVGKGCSWNESLLM